MYHHRRTLLPKQGPDFDDYRLPAFAPALPKRRLRRREGAHLLGWRYGGASPATDHRLDRSGGTRDVICRKVLPQILPQKLPQILPQCFAAIAATRPVITRKHRRFPESPGPWDPQFWKICGKFLPQILPQCFAAIAANGSGICGKNEGSIQM